MYTFFTTSFPHHYYRKIISSSSIPLLYAGHSHLLHILAQLVSAPSVPHSSYVRSQGFPEQGTTHLESLPVLSCLKSVSSEEAQKHAPFKWHDISRVFDFFTDTVAVSVTTLFYTLYQTPLYWTIYYVWTMNCLFIGCSWLHFQDNSMWTGAVIWASEGVEPEKSE